MSVDWGLGGGVLIHKLSSHMKCLVTHVKDLGRYPTTHETSNNNKKNLKIILDYFLCLQKIIEIPKMEASSS